jgi:biopolymer transport protein ExbD
MRFHIRKRRATPTIIIVALIDVLIVLLIFLMVTTTFRQQAEVKLSLPESKHTQQSGANDVPPLVVTIDSKGDLRLKTGTDELPVTTERMKEEFAARLAKNPELRLTISADKTAPWGQVIKVWDAAKDAKFSSVSAFAKEAKP